MQIVDEKLKKIQESYILPGFKKGGVPIKVIKERFGNKLLEEEGKKIINMVLKKLEESQEQVLTSSREGGCRNGNN